MNPSPATGHRLGPEARNAFRSLDAALTIRGETVNEDHISTVRRLELDGRGYYFKYYSRRRRGINWIVGRSKLQREVENLGHFTRWHLPTPVLVACWNEFGLFGGGRGGMVTEEVSGSSDLAALAEAASPLFNNPEWLDQVIEQVADAARAMHDRRFAHNDFKWRNILVSGSASTPRITLIDCPAGAFWREPFFEYRRIKDLASLDKIGQRVLTVEQRLSFMRRYHRLAPHEDFSPRHLREFDKITRFLAGRNSADR